LEQSPADRAVHSVGPARLNGKLFTRPSSLGARRRVFLLEERCQKSTNRRASEEPAGRLRPLAFGPDRPPNEAKDVAQRISRSVTVPRRPRPPRHPQSAVPSRKTRH
jgi:hypothetical protein